MTKPDINVDDLKVSSYEISLAKLAGTAIKDIHGYLSRDFGDGAFIITKIVLENGESIHVGGEHDAPYLEASYDHPRLGSPALSRLKNIMDGKPEEEDEENGF